MSGKPACFITFEGGEGAGKSTQIRSLAARLGQAGVDALVTREPGGTPVANAVRSLLVSKAVMKLAPMFFELFDRLGGLAAADGEDDAEAIDAVKAMFVALGAPIDPRAEALLLFAARADHWGQAIAPMLANGRWVLCDRFSDSTLAYQGVAEGVGLDYVAGLARAALPDAARPDLTLLLDLDPRDGLARAKASRNDTSRYEDKDIAYHDAVRAAFLEIAAREPERMRVIDAAQPLDAVEADIWRAVAPLLESAPARAR